eukprot:1178658-Prorocentrum_minimum.AAC.3
MAVSRSNPDQIPIRDMGFDQSARALNLSHAATSRCVSRCSCRNSRAFEVAGSQRKPKCID